MSDSERATGEVRSNKPSAIGVDAGDYHLMYEPAMPNGRVFLESIANSVSHPEQLEIGGETFPEPKLLVLNYVMDEKLVVESAQDDSLNDLREARDGCNGPIIWG